MSRYNKLPKCVNCMFYQSSASSMGMCGRIFLKDYPPIETFFYPKCNIARSDKNLCGIEGRHFADKIFLKKCNISHMIG